MCFYLSDVKLSLKPLEDQLTPPKKVKQKVSKGSKASSMSCVTGETFLLQKEKAALKATLAFVEEEQKIKMEQKKAKLIKLEQEERS